MALAKATSTNRDAFPMNLAGSREFTGRATVSNAGKRILEDQAKNQ